MPTMPTAQPRRFPSHVYIGAMFTLLLMLASLMSGLFNYWQTSQLILSSSNKLFSRIEQNVQQDLTDTYQPVRHLLSLIASASRTTIDSPMHRHQTLAMFAQALRDNPNLASLYLGFENGDFLMVRPLRSEALRRAFAAPPRAAYQMWRIKRLGAEAVSESQFFDEALNSLEQRMNPAEQYDPRDRAWYQRARSEAGQITTAPYVFFSSHAVGTTLALRVGSDRVIAADLMLAGLSATLIKHQVTPSTQVLLYDAAGNAIAYPESDRLIVDHGTSRLARAADLSPSLGELFAGEPQASGRLHLARRDWVVSRSEFHEGGPDRLRLALLVPEDELLSDACHILWQSALVSLAVLLLCLPIGWLVSRMLVRPLAWPGSRGQYHSQLQVQPPAQPAVADSGNRPATRIHQRTTHRGH